MANKKMSDGELLSVISNAERDAVIFSGENLSTNTRLLKDYLQFPYGDEVEDQSQVISPDVQDVVEADMPSLARVFLGSSQPVSFSANTDRPEEVKEVEEKNKYVNWMIMEQSWSFDVLFKWMKDAEIQTNGVVKYFIEDQTKTEEESFTGVTKETLQGIIDSLKTEDVSNVEIVGRGENIEGEEFDVTFKVTRGTKQFKVIGVPAEQFLISRSANSVDDAELVGDKVRKTRGTLLAEGFDRKIINELPKISSDENQTSGLEAVRDKDIGGTVQEASIAGWASEIVEITDLYVLIDFDGDGIAERRHILKSGNHILVNEAFDHVPYASLSCISMPHKAIGRSRAQITQQTQRVKTVVMRQTLDNMYMVNHPRNVVHPDINIDDMLNVRPNGIVRMKKGTTAPVNGAVFPLVTPYVGDKSLQIIQYLDNVRAQSTGTYVASQGLDSEAIGAETATRFNGIREDSKAKIELVARVFAETGFRKLYEGAAWMASQFQDKDTEIKVLGKALTVNPSNWKYRHSIVSKVGLGSGQNDQIVGSMQGIFSIQEQLRARGSATVDEVKVFNTLTEIMSGLGFKDTTKFFNDPEVPEDILQAENEILRSSVEQLQQMVNQLQNPLAEAAEVERKAKQETDNKKLAIDAAKLSENQRQFDVEQSAKVFKNEQDLALEITSLELEHDKQIQGGL